MGLKHLLWESPAAGSDSPCILDSEQTLSYAEVEARAAACAEQLSRLGIGAGDVVGIMLKNSPAFLICMLGVWRLGAAATPINFTFTERELGYQLDDSGAKLLITSSDTVGSAAQHGVAVLDVSELHTSAQGDASAPAIDPEQIALLIYTSGSTGQPKGVMLDHANLEAVAEGWSRHTEMTSADRALLMLPLFHVNAICLSWLAPISVGGSTVVLERFKPDVFVEAAERFRPTYFSAVPAVLARLIELPADQQPDLTSVRFAICGAAPVSKELLQQCAERFGLTIIEGYGLTEGTCVSACNPLRGPHKLGTVGPALEGQRIRIADEDGRELPVGERGEVQISGPLVMRGYLGRPEATESTVVDGWLRTGDVGILDEDGYLQLVDRIKDMIIRGGENLYPKEIEAYLATHPAVLETAAVGAAHSTLGEVPVAYVVLQPGADVGSDELLAHCAEGLMKIKVPARIEILAALPRNPVGKIDKPELRRRTAPDEAPVTTSIPVS